MSVIAKRISKYIGYLAGDNNIISTTVFFSIALNLTGHHIAFDNSYRFLYLDMIGTFITSVILGPVWGSIVGIITNIFTSFNDPRFVYFTVVNVSGAVYWGFFANKKYFSLLGGKTTWKSIVRYIFCAGIVAGAVTSIFATIIQHYIFEYKTGSYSSHVAEYFRHTYASNDDIVTALIVFLSDVVLSIPDKIMTSIIGLLIIASLFRYFADNIIADISSSELTKSPQVQKTGKREVILILFTSSIYLLRLAYVSLNYDMSGIANQLLMPNTASHIIMITTMIAPLLLLFYIIIYHAETFNCITNPMLERKMIDNETTINEINWLEFAIFTIVILLSISMFYLLLFHMVNITPKAYYANQELPKTSFLVVVSLILLIISYFLVDNNNCKIAANLVRVIKKDTEINLYSALVHQLRNKLPAARLKVMNMIDDLADTDIEVDSFRETLMTTDRILEQVEGQLGAVDKLFTEKVDIFEVCNIRDLFEQHVFPVFESKCYKLNLQCNTNIELPLNKHSFIDAISNLITNAEAHAFDANCHNNNIYFWVKDGKHDTVIDYANDGEPFPRDITKEMFLSYGGKSSASSGQGIGGAYISKMISAHKGRFDIVKDNRFGVYFRITLPKEVNT